MSLLIGESLLMFAISADPTPYVPAFAPNLDWLGPVAGALGAIVVALIGGISIVWRRRQDKKDLAEDRISDSAPKITDGWEEVRAARQEASRYYSLYRTFENLYYTAFSALRHLARKNRDTRPDEAFDQDVIDALATDPPDTSEITKK